MWCLLAMMPGVTTAQDCSTSVSADVATPCHDVWCDNGSRVLNWYDNDNCLRLLNWCDWVGIGLGVLGRRFWGQGLTIR